MATMASQHIERVPPHNLEAEMALLGSEFGGRHLQYEKFYAGPPFLVRNYNYTWAPWGTYDAIVDDLMAQYDVPHREAVSLT